MSECRHFDLIIFPVNRRSKDNNLTMKIGFRKEMPYNSFLLNKEFKIFSFISSYLPLHQNTKSLTKILDASIGRLSSTDNPLTDH